MTEELISIEKMAFGGAGLGHVAGKVCFVPFSAPGDIVKVRFISEKRSFIQGELSELTASSSLRATPPCPIFGSCGGCNWQHLSYQGQVESKQEIFADLMWRFGRVERSRILPVIAAPEQYRYRSRVQFKVNCSAGSAHVGFYRAGSHSVIDVPGECAIADPVINRFFQVLQNVSARCAAAAPVSQVDVAVGDDGSAIVVFHCTGGNTRELARHLQAQPGLAAAGIYIKSGAKGSLQKVAGPDILSYRLPHDLFPGSPEQRLIFSPSAFSQVNYRQNLALIKTVVDWAELRGDEKILDLYCGNGNFSIPLSRRAAAITGIEGFSPSVADAVRNAELNGVKNCRFSCRDAAAGLLDLIKGGETFDLVVLDPPRAGAADLMRHIPAVKPARILYVSCDPVTLARDIGTLRAAGYEVAQSQPVDMFPQTYHIESVTLLTEAKKSAQV